MATKFLTKGRKRDERGRQLEPVARNAFRTLGLPASASQGEIQERAASLRLAHKLGVEKTFDADLLWLGPLSRTEADVRDALGRLADPPRRVLERLFWFHAVPASGPPAGAAQIREAVDGLLLAETPSARHDAALFALCALQRLDPEFKEQDAWARAYALWREVLGREEFWSLLVASDLKGEFEQLANYGEANALRERAPRLLTSTVAERARAAVARDDFETGARSLGVLRAASLPAALLGEYESAALGHVEDRAEKICDEAFGMVGFYYGGEDDRLRHKYYFDEAWKNFHWRLKPFLARFLRLAGARSHAFRRSCEHAAENLNVLGAGYDRHGFRGESLHLYRQARTLAPPGSAALAAAEEGLRSLDPAAVLPAHDEALYAAALSAELTDMSVPPKLFEGGVLTARAVGVGDTWEGCASHIAFYAFFVALCFLLNKCGIINTRRSVAPPPPYFNFNYNYNAPRIVIPPMPKLEPMNIPPLTTPTPAKKTRRGRRPAGVQRKAGEGTGAEALPPPPPTTTTGTRGPAPAGTPKD